MAGGSRFRIYLVVAGGDVCAGHFYLYGKTLDVKIFLNNKIIVSKKRVLYFSFIVICFFVNSKIFAFTPSKYQLDNKNVNPNYKGIKVLPSKKTIGEWKNFNKQYNNRWKIRFSPRAGYPSAIYGYKTRSKKGEPDEIAKEFITQKHELLNIDVKSLKSAKISKRKKWNHIKYEQQYKGISVEGGKVLVHQTDKGEIAALYSDYFHEINISIIPKITNASAIKIVENELKPKLPPKKQPKTELVIFPSPIDDKYYLSYKVKFICEEPLGNWIYFIDANTGNIIFKYNDLRFGTSGTINGKIFPSVGTDSLIEEPFANTSVVVNGSTETTNASGYYSSSQEGAITGMLSGPYATVMNGASGEWKDVSYATSTPHNYPNNYEYWWTINQAGATRMKIHFLNFNTEAGYDGVYIYDCDGNLVTTYTGNLGDFWSEEVSGDTMYIYFVSDNIYAYYGLDIDAYSYLLSTGPLSEDISPSYTWNYVSTNTHCDEVNMFYHINLIHDYYKNTHDFSGMDYSIKSTVHFGKDYCGAFFNPEDANIYFGDGDGGTSLNNPSRARDVIYHEYTHAAVNHIYELVYYGQSGAMDEAFADYFSASYTNDSRIGEWVMLAAVQRNLVNTNTYPDDMTNEVHDDGLIYSGALWDIRQSLGQEISDKIIFESLFFQPDNFIRGREAVLMADDDNADLSDGTPHYSEINTAFYAHGISSSPLAGDTYEPNETFNSAYGYLTAGTTYYSYVYHKGDCDYYKIQAGTGMISVTLTSLPADNDLYLFNCNQELVSYSGNGGTANESIVYSTTDYKGIYYIAVMPYLELYNSGDSYALCANFSSLSADTTPPTGNPSAPIDRGLYSGSTVTFQWTQSSAQDNESGIVGYYLQVSTNVSFAFNIFDADIGNYLIKEITGCLNGFTYYAKVRAKNGVGFYSTYSGISNGITIDVTPPVGTPNSPVDRGNWGSSEITFSWTIGNANDPESGISGYYLQVSTWQGVGEKIDGYVGDVSSKTITNCENGKTYYARVKARNGAGLYTDWSGWSDGIIIDTSPPSGLLVVRDGTSEDIDYPEFTTTLSANWDAASDSESGIARYWYAIGLSTVTTDIVDWTNAGLSTSVTKTGLNISYAITYYFLVKAENNAGLYNQQASDGQTIIDFSSPTLSQVRDGLYSDMDYTTFLSTLSANWDVAIDSESVITRYWYAIGTSPGATNFVAWTDVGISTWVTRGGLSLTNGTTYYFTVKAENGSGYQSIPSLSDGTIVDFTSPVINIVRDGTSADVDFAGSSTQLSANWDAASDSESGIAKYWYGIATTQLGTTFSDDMEGFPSGWTLSGTSGQYWTKSSVRKNSGIYSAKCTPNANYNSNVDVYMERSVNLVNFSSANLSFNVWQYTRDSSSSYYYAGYVYVQYYTDSWNTAWSRAGSYQNWEQISVEIPISATKIRFYFHSGNYYSYEGVYIDDVVLTGTGGSSTPDVADWTDVGLSTSVKKTGLSLTNGTTYYFWVKAENGAGLTSEITTSDGQYINIAPLIEIAQTEINDGGLVYISGSAESGSQIDEIIIEDQRGNLLWKGINENITITADGIISGTIDVGEITKNYPLTTKIKIEIKIIDASGNNPPSTNSFWINLQISENNFSCWNNILKPIQNKPATVRYQVKSGGYVRINIYNMAGELVRTLVNEVVPAEFNGSKDWFGKNDVGDIVGSGVYFIHIEAPGIRETKKIVVVK